MPAALPQFKEIGPPPFPQAVAHQKIQLLLTSVNPANRKQTVATLSGWTAWYRDILDEELIAAWKRDSRANLPDVIVTMSDERVASGIVSFSWKESRPTTFIPAYAPMLTNLMARYPKSSEPFVQDLLRNTPDLSREEQEGVCRVLLTMPDLGTWHDTALQVLPRYGETTRRLLSEDLHSGDDERLLRSKMWASELSAAGMPTGSPPPLISRQQTRRREPPRDDNGEAIFEGPRRVHVDGPPAAMETEPKQARVTLPSASTLPSPPQPKAAYDGPRTGTYETTGGPIPQNAEYVFRNLPMLQMHLEYDAKIWDVRFSPGDGKTQRLIVRNKSSSPQKRCVIRWSIVP